MKKRKKTASKRIFISAVLGSVPFLFHSVAGALVIPMTTGQMEALTVNNVNGTFQTVMLEQAYTNPVVVCTNILDSVADPAVVVRLNNVTASSFDIQLQVAYGPGSPVAANVHCIIAEEGINELSDGTDFEARTVLSDGKNHRSSWSNAQLENVTATGVVTGSYTSPVVLGQVMTYNDSDFSVFWTNNCVNRTVPFNGSGNLCVGRHTGFDRSARANETLGFFVIEAGSGSSNPSDLDCIGHEFAPGGDIIDGTASNGNSYTLSDTYVHGVSTQNAEDGGDGGWAVLFGADPLASSAIDLAIDETDTRNGTSDNNRGHTTENTSYWVFRTVDYGDAPDSYSTTDAAAGAEHLLSAEFVVNGQNDIFIGSAVDRECDATPDLLAGSDTDDGGVVFPLTPINFSAGDSYTVSVPYTGDARLCGWIDFDYNGQSGDGTFEIDERACIDTIACPGAGTSGACDLTFTAPADFVHNDNQVTYSRFRIGPTASEIESPNGLASGGEVEDYQITVDTLPVTLSAFSGERRGDQVEIDWSTSSELFNVGFQLWGLDGTDSKWSKLHSWLVRSGSGNAVESQSYTQTVRVPGAIGELVAVGISSVDSDGSEHYYGPFELGRRYGNLGSLKPIAWDHIRDRADARMRARGYVRDRLLGYARAGGSAQSAATGGANHSQVLEFSVREPGMYRVTAQALLSAGIDWTGMARREIALVDHTGEAVVRYVRATGSGSGRSRTLGHGGEIYFYAQGVDRVSGLYSGSSVYRLLADRYRAVESQYQGRRGIDGGYSAYYRATVRSEHDRHYALSSAADDPWLDAVVLSYADQPASYAAALEVAADALWEHDAVLTLELAGGSALPAVDGDGDGVQDAEHRVEAVVLSADAVGGLRTLGRSQSLGRGRWTPSFTIAGGTPLTLTDGKAVVGGIFSAGTGYGFSEVQVDGVRLDYARPYVARAGEPHLEFKAPSDAAAGYEVTVPDHGRAMVFAHSNGNLVRVQPESQVIEQGLRRVRFAALAGAAGSDMPVEYWVSGQDGFSGVEGLRSRPVVSAASLLAQASGSTLLMVAHPVFMTDALTGYAQFKRSQGYTVSIVNYLDIVDAFGGGQPGPLGLTRYLGEVAAGGGIEHVLLVGGSSYDHRDNLGSGAMTFIPGHYGRSGYSDYTVSDVPYVTGSDQRLFATIGRWPVRSEADLEAIIAHSMRWSHSGAERGRVLAVAEHTVAGEGLDFGAALDGVVSQLPARWQRQQVYVDTIRAQQPALSLAQSLARARGQMIGALESGVDVVLYNGHATTSQLSNKGLFRAADVAGLDSETSQLWIAMSCYVTYYESTHVNTLAHQLLFSGAAVGITGAMLLSNQAENIAAGKAIVNSTVNGEATIGEAVRAHKRAQSSASLNLNLAHLGDPTLKM